MTVRWFVPLLLLLALLGAACGGDSATAPEPEPSTSQLDEPEPTTPEAAEPPATRTTGPATTAASETSDLVDVPSPATPEYVDAVLAEIDRVFAESFTVAADQETASDVDALQLLTTVATSGYAVDYLEDFDEAFSTDVIARPAGAPSTATSTILDQTDDCILVTAEHDLRPLVSNDVTLDVPTSGWTVYLQREEPAGDRSWPWLLGGRSIIDLGGEEPTTCEAMADYARANY